MLSTLPSTNVVGTVLTATVRAYDFNSNLAIFEDANIVVTCTGALTTQTLALAMVAGTASASFSYTVPQSVSVAITSTTSSNQVTLSPAQAITFIPGLNPQCLW